MSSKRITIKRNSNFLMRAQGSGVNDFFDGASMSIGSYWEKSNSGRVASGLTPDEEMELLPIVLGLPCDDRDFWKKRDDYYTVIDTKVPAKGAELEIGLTKDNAPAGANNKPIAIVDYLKYRHALKHPWVVPSQDEAIGNALAKFYIFDAVQATSANATDLDRQDEALAMFFQVKKNADKVNQMLISLNVDYRDINGQNPDHTSQLRAEKLRELAVSQASEFVRIHEDTDFEVKYELAMMLKTGVMKKAGGKYIIAETGKVIGNDDDTIMFLKDVAANSEHIAMLKGRMQDAVKDGRKATKKPATKR